jgi:hypothetical protein
MSSLTVSSVRSRPVHPNKEIVGTNIKEVGEGVVSNMLDPINLNPIITIVSTIAQLVLEVV